MVLDASAIIAIHLREPGYEELITRMDEAEFIAIGAPTLLASAMVLTARLSRDARPLLAAFTRKLDAEIIPFTREHFETALDAFVRFGRGRHKAALNFGDCMAYATASLADQPLLFTGKDFARTDIRAA